MRKALIRGYGPAHPPLLCISKGRHRLGGRERSFQGAMRRSYAPGLALLHLPPPQLRRMANATNGPALFVLLLIYDEDLLVVAARLIPNSIDQPGGYPKFNFSKNLICERAQASRREWDSNPRNRFRFCGFQDRCIKPLCHLSIRVCGSFRLRFRRLETTRRRSFRRD
jgi:hypothetical protein